ncbi:DUF6157 family protein [Paraflavitalea sp. CAU 1676]|uniref:DUF6157 family protein n=1 Tax=Paraflavitalea sp. CAU 1676 TaxID=3032598 RepID=UPI0023DCCFAF|nr:DUF6157 family protein [Paraflavitalea sp. CAU 1676]MDF2189126.1 DUF6157 family protein [Paraflavitalea sp. CAU 1676]
MKDRVHTTNYHNTFIEIADDCPVRIGEVPPQKGDSKTVANHQFDLIAHNPYKYTSDDILFQVYAIKNNIDRLEQPAARAAFFSKGQPCLRSSPLSKRYGWGIHSDAEGKVALYAVDSPEYRQKLKDKTLQHVRAMRSKKA